MADHFQSPLTIYVLWHPAFSDGGKLADRLFTTLSRDVNDPFTRTIGIPVYYRSKPAGAGCEAPAPIPLKESEYNAIVVFVDPNLLLSEEWKNYVRDLLAKMVQDPDHTRIFPIANDFNSFKSQELGVINYIRMFEADDREDLGSFLGPAPKPGSQAPASAGSAIATAGPAAGGVSVVAGPPAGPGHGINVNITINTAGASESTSLRIDPPAVQPAPAVESPGAGSAPSGCGQSPPEVAAAAAPDAEEILLRRGNLLLSKLVHELCRLIVSPPQTSEEGTTTSAKPINLFLSHAKADGADIAKDIKNYIEEDAAMKTFFDANDIAPGYRFSDELRGAIESSTLICILTDYYATREWCLFEVITAKRLNRPVVVVNAVEEREPRSFPYLGNVPTMRWSSGNKTRIREVVDMALFEVLDVTYNHMFQEALLRLYKLPKGAHPVGHPPELFTILRLREKLQNNGDGATPDAGPNYVLYPDPPLGDEEIKLLQDLSPDMRFITPTMLPAIEHQLISK